MKKNTGLALVVFAGLCGPVAAQDRPTVAMIGTGRVGGSLGPAIAALGYPLVYGSREPGRESVRELVARSGPNASAADQREAAARSDIIFLAVPAEALEEVSRSVGDLSGKIVVDMTSSLKRQAADGYLELVSDTSNSERLQFWHPAARVVRMYIPTMVFFQDPLLLGTPPTVPIAANDPRAKEAVARIIFDIGLDPYDAGPLRMARSLDAMGLMFWVTALQQRKQGYELRLMPSSLLSCFVNLAEGYEKPYDFDDLAQFPEREPPVPCDAWKLPDQGRDQNGKDPAPESR